MSLEAGATVGWYNITSVKERSYKQMKELNKHIIEYNEQIKNKEL